MKKKVLIIGSGLGGLATALRLSKRGYDIEIVEKYHSPGGRLNKIEKDGFLFDTGPSFFSMSYEFDEFLNDCDLEGIYDFVELNPLYKVNFAKGKKNYTIYKELKKLAAEFKAEEPDFEKQMLKYLQAAGKLFHDVNDIVIKKNFKSKIHYLVQLMRVPLTHLPKLWRSMWKELNETFTSYEVKVIFSLVAFFLGAPPFETSAVFNVLTYTELQHNGYHNIKGGMYQIVAGLTKELEKQNINIHFDTEIVSYNSNGKRCYDFIDQNGKKWSADIFVVNSDAAYFRGKVLNRKTYHEKKLDKMKWTIAPFSMYLGVKGKIEHLDHHNYFLGTNFNDYSKNLLKTSITPEKPYYYVNVNSKFNKECAPEGHENLFVLCPVPDLRYKKDWNDSEKLSENIIRNLSERIDFDIDANLAHKTVWTPVEWENQFNLYKGSGLGLAHNLKQIGALRPQNIDEKFQNVFYVGASTIPGTGLPMVIISSRLVTEQIEKKFK